MVIQLLNLLQIHCSKMSLLYHVITITHLEKSSEIGNFMVIRYHRCSASLGPFSDPFTTNLISLPYFSLFFERFMVINDHSKTFQAQHLDFFWFFKKSLHHTIFFQKKNLIKNGICITTHPLKGQILWYYFSLLHQSTHFISIFSF